MGPPLPSPEWGDYRGTSVTLGECSAGGGQASTVPAEPHSCPTPHSCNLSPVSSLGGGWFNKKRDREPRDPLWALELTLWGSFGKPLNILSRFSPFVNRDH